MVLQLDIKSTLKNKVKVSRVVLISGLLTFLYCIEFYIGIRTVYYAFKLWSDSTEIHGKNISWTLCVACLLTANVTAFSINVLSAMWEQKQLEEKGKEKSSIRFTFHIIIGGMLWRYVHLWFIESKEFQKKGALLLAMTKFFFTQSFTIPMVIVHVSIMNNLEELMYDICGIFCISLNLILTCTMFSWCSKEVEELRKWECETVDLIPLIFQTVPTNTPDNNNKVSSYSTNKEDVTKSEKKECNCGNDFEETLIKSIVFLQSFGFSIGRILALGILLKVAGKYALSIMFLQLLISVIYLKFQTPILVSDSLPKWKQLTRLSFLSYILIFEWHLNRDPRTAYDFSSSMKHSILYYCAATVESVFYLVTWAITTNYALKSESTEIRSQNNKFCRIILVIGTVSLVFSLTLHIVLLFWGSRKISKLIYSIRRQYETAKLRLSKRGDKEKEDGEGRIKYFKRSQISHIDISSPIPIKRNDELPSQEQNDLEKHSSYLDLKEPLDDEIEIYFRKCDNSSRNNVDEAPINTKNPSISNEKLDKSDRKMIVKTLDHILHNEINNSHQNNSNYNEKPATIVPTNTTLDINRTEINVCRKEKDEKAEDKSLKSKISLFSNSISEKLGKVSSLPKKFAGTLKDQFQKTTNPFQSTRNASTDSKKTDKLEKKSSLKAPSTDKTLNLTNKITNENVSSAEGFFVGDARCYQIESLSPLSLDQTNLSKHIRFDDSTPEFKSFGSETDDEIFPNSDTVHKEGDTPCSCYICKTLGDGRFRRRRSSSVPASDRKVRHEEEDGKTLTSSRYNMSNPDISQNNCDRENANLKRISPPSKIRESIFNLSQLSLNNKIEHYV